MSSSILTSPAAAASSTTGGATEAKQDTAITALDTLTTAVRAGTTATAQQYNQAGVIAINTDVLIIDCLALGSVSIQCTAMGTSGVITAYWTNATGTLGIAAVITSPSGSVSASISAAGLWSTRVQARYLRLRLTTATSAGTTTLEVLGLPYDGAQTYILGGSINAVSTVSTLSTISAGTNLIADVGLQHRANATGAATIKHIVSAASTNATNAKASAGRVVGWQFANLAAAWRWVKLHNTAGTPTAGAGVVMAIGIPEGGSVSASFPVGLAFSTGIAYTIVQGNADSDATAVSVGDVVGSLNFA